MVGRTTCLEIAVVNPCVPELLQDPVDGPHSPNLWSDALLGYGFCVGAVIVEILRIVGAIGRDGLLTCTTLKEDEAIDGNDHVQLCLCCGIEVRGAIDSGATSPRHRQLSAP